MRQVTIAALLFAACFATGIGSAFACGNGKLIIEDKFTSLDRAWKFDGGDGGMFSTGQDGLVAEVPPKKTLSAIHEGGRYENFEVCAKFEAKSVKDSGDFFALRFNKGIFLVNGKKIGEFSGDPPEGGSVFGFALYSGKANTEPTTFVLKSIELREPSMANQ